MLDTPGIGGGFASEAQLRPKLQDAWVVRRGHVSEVPIIRARIDTKEFGVVESIEGLESQFKFHPFRDRNGFEQRQVEVEEAGPNDRVFPCVAKALVGTAIPRGDRGRKGAGAKPGIDGVRVANRGDLIGPISRNATQPERVLAVVADPIAAIHWDSGLCHGYAGEFPSPKYGPQRAVRSVRREEWEAVNVIGVEDMPPVERSRPAVIGQVERIGSRIEIIAHHIDLVRPGVGQLERKPMAILHSDTPWSEL